MTIAAAPNPVRATAAEVSNDLAYEAIIECCELTTSYATSAREAAWRGDRQLLTGHLAQLRACAVTALDAHKRLAPQIEVAGP